MTALTNDWRSWQLVQALPSVIETEQENQRLLARVERLIAKGVTSEIVRGKRSISKAQVKALAEFFHVSPELFI